MFNDFIYSLNVYAKSYLVSTLEKWILEKEAEGQIPTVRLLIEEITETN